jgi:esterase/lipase
MKKILRRISILLLFGYVGSALFLYINQRSLLYFPTPILPTEHPEMTLQNEGESINFIVLNEGNQDAIIYFGGNAESMARSSDEIARQFPAFTVYLMDYRGYGRSTGDPSEEALYSDALKLYDAIKSNYESISIGGRSLGSGIAVYVAAHREVSKLALITPYDSIVNVAKGMYPLFPISSLLHDEYNAISMVKDIKSKTLIIMAENDTVIEKERTQQLIDAFDTALLEVITIKNRGHIDISSDSSYYKSMQDFIGQE